MNGRRLIEGGRSFLPVCELDRSHLGWGEPRRAAKAPGGIAGWRSNKNKAGSLTIPGLVSAAARDRGRLLGFALRGRLGSGPARGFRGLGRRFGRLFRAGCCFCHDSLQGLKGLHGVRARASIRAESPIGTKGGSMRLRPVVHLFSSVDTVTLLLLKHSMCLDQGAKRASWREMRARRTPRSGWTDWGCACTRHSCLTMPPSSRVPIRFATAAQQVQSVSHRSRVSER
jgi:hypothetical protein